MIITPAMTGSHSQIEIPPIWISPVENAVKIPS